MATAASLDFGLKRDSELKDKSMNLFGVGKPLAASSTTTADPSLANANAAKLATFVKGLQVRVVTQGVAGQNLDQMGLWPDDLHPTHLIVANEQGTAEPGLQSIDIETGEVTTLVTGTTVTRPGARYTLGNHPVR